METHPLTHAYWQSAAGELRDVRKLTFAALCMALCIALSALPSVPLWGGARITWGFLARSVCAWVCGPVLGTGLCLRGGPFELFPHRGRRLSLFPRLYPDHYAGCFSIRTVFLQVENYGS